MSRTRVGVFSCVGGVFLLLAGCSAHTRGGSSDMAADSPVVTQLRAHFHTLDDDKDRGDGISESYYLDTNEVMGSNQSWGKDLVYRNDSHDEGQSFDVSKYKVKLNELSRVQYRFDMDNNDGWNVVITIYAKAGDHEYNVAEQLWNIANHNSRSGSMNLKSIAAAQMKAAEVR